MIWDVSVTTAYITLVLDDSQLDYQKGLSFYLKHMSENKLNTPDGIRRADPKRGKYQYDYFFKPSF